MKQITESVIFIKGQDDFIPDAHAYVIGIPTSKDLTLVEAGLMGKGPYKIKAIQTMGIELSSIKRVIMTHTHLDHIGCLPEILKEIPHAELWIHKEEADPLEGGDDSHMYGMDMFKSMCESQYGIGPDTFAFSIDRKLEGGESLDLGGSKWEVIYIPGHSKGSIGLYNGLEKILIPGDVVYADYAIGRFDLHGANGAELMNSLMSLAELDVDILLPGHNNIVEGLPEGYIERTAKQWEPYLR